MKTAILIVMLLVSKVYATAQKQPEDFGYRHLALKFQNDPVDVIIVSKDKEARIAKPLLFFCQGSLPQPVIKYDEKGLFGILPFNENIFLAHFHIAIVGKPFIPVIADAKTLGENFNYYKDADKKLPPKAYSDRNFLDYYVTRNNFIIKQLAKERWVSSRTIVVAGHSEGATIAAKMAATNKKITHLIYSGGNPYGRIASVLAEARFSETAANDTGNNAIEYWKSVVRDQSDLRCDVGDSPKTTFDFSQPQSQNILKTTIPVLVAYGTKDWSAPYNDLLYTEAIRLSKANITFKPYFNLEHNFFATNAHNRPVLDNHNWDSVAGDWFIWLQSTI